MLLRLHRERVLALLRLVLTLIAVIEGAGKPGHDAPFFVAAGGYALFGLVMLWRGSAKAGGVHLFGLFADTVFLLIMGNHVTVANHGRWIGVAAFVYVISGTALLYGPREVIVIAGICSVFFLLASTHASPLSVPILAGGTVAFFLAAERTRLNARLQAAEQEVVDARKAAEEAREEERQRIAADFHDGPLQSFISFQMRLEILRKIIERDPKVGLEELRQLQQLSKTQVAEIRTFVRSMRPLNVEGTTLSASVRRIAEDFQKETGIPVTFLGGDANLPVAPEIISDIIQMVREALHNVQKHASATRVAVAMEKAGKALEISVDDNGSGFHFSGVYNLEELDLLRLGPVSLKQRARSLNAELQLESRPGRGSSLRMRIPL